MDSQGESEHFLRPKVPGPGSGRGDREKEPSGSVYFSHRDREGGKKMPTTRPIEIATLGLKERVQPWRRELPASLRWENERRGVRRSGRNTWPESKKHQCLRSTGCLGRPPLPMPPLALARGPPRAATGPALRAGANRARGRRAAGCSSLFAGRGLHTHIAFFFFQSVQRCPEVHPQCNFCLCSSSSWNWLLFVWQPWFYGGV